VARSPSRARGRNELPPMHVSTAPSRRSIGCPVRPRAAAQKSLATSFRIIALLFRTSYNECHLLAMPLLFSYGSLQQPEVQRSTFGRLLHGEADELPEFEPSLVQIEDVRIVAASGVTSASTWRKATGTSSSSTRPTTSPSAARGAPGQSWPRCSPTGRTSQHSTDSVAAPTLYLVLAG